MELTKNRFKAGLKSGKQQIGMWNSIHATVLPEIGRVHV